MPSYQPFFCTHTLDHTLPLTCPSHTLWQCCYVVMIKFLGPDFLLKLVENLSVKLNRWLDLTQNYQIATGCMASSLLSRVLLIMKSSFLQKRLVSDVVLLHLCSSRNYHSSQPPSGLEIIKYSRQYARCHWLIGVFRWEYVNTLWRHALLNFRNIL